jgi:hypothetical protein
MRHQPQPAMSAQLQYCTSLRFYERCKKADKGLGNHTSYFRSRVEQALQQCLEDQNNSLEISLQNYQIPPLKLRISNITSIDSVSNKFFSYLRTQGSNVFLHYENDSTPQQIKSLHQQETQALIFINSSICLFNSLTGNPFSAVQLLNKNILKSFFSCAILASYWILASDSASLRI